MKLHEWEIWHTYTSYFNTSFVDLEDVARRLVKSGLAYLTFHRDGLTYWQGKDGVGEGISTVNLSPEKHRATISLDPINEDQPELEGFSAEAWGQACYFRFSEKRLFGSELPLPHPYIRVFLGKCNLLIEESSTKINLYPIAIIYASGVIIVEFRTISPDHEIDVDEFISGAVNLFQFQFDRIEVSPSLSKLATQAWYHSNRKWKLHHRAALMFLEKDHDIAVSQLTENEKSGDFTFEMAPLSNSEEQDYFEQMSSLALTLFHTIAFVISKPRKGLKFLIRGQSNIIEVGGYWSGRPHIYLIRFEGQKNTAKENEEAHKALFGSIMIRSSTPEADTALKYLPKNCRVFPDYCSYISGALSLWVWSLNGLKQQEPWKDANRGHLIYEHQATVELIEYVYMLHRSLLEQINKLGNTDEVLFFRRALIELEQQLSEPSHFGEIRNLLKQGWRAFGLTALRNRIKESLAIIEAQTSLKEARTTKRIGITLSIIFGLIAVPPTAEKVLKPIWKMLNIWRPQSEEMFALLLMSISLTFVLFILILLLRFFSGSESKSTDI